MPTLLTPHNRTTAPSPFMVLVDQAGTGHTWERARLLRSLVEVADARGEAQQSTVFNTQSIESEKTLVYL
jgi:hypothetical protein